MDEAAAIKRAKDLFQQGLPDQAQEIVDQLLKENPRSAAALNVRAFLLYQGGRLEDAIAAYRRLGELEPRVAGHQANLGLICFKSQRFLEAQSAFERQLELEPDNPKALRNLGFCHERQQSLEKALDCFTRAGDEASAAKVRERLVGPERAARGGAAAAGAGVEGAPPRRPARGEGAAVAPQAALEHDVSEWLERASLPRPGEGPELMRAGPGELLTTVREKVYVNPACCAGHRGVVVFAPAFREAEKAAGKFGDKRTALARAEGNGELVLSGGGRGLHAVHLAGGRLFVNWGSLAMCGTGIAVSVSYAGALKLQFLAVELSGTGSVILAVRGAPMVLPVLPDLPTLARPEAVVAWTQDLTYDEEVVPELRKLVGKEEALRYRFEGRGYLILQSC